MTYLQKTTCKDKAPCGSLPPCVYQWFVDVCQYRMGHMYDDDFNIAWVICMMTDCFYYFKVV